MYIAINILGKSGPQIYFNLNVLNKSTIGEILRKMKTNATLLVLAALLTATIDSVKSDYYSNSYHNHEFAIDPLANIWTQQHGIETTESNGTLGAGLAMGCNYCGDFFYHEPPPSDILFMPPPPLPQSYQAAIASQQQSQSADLVGGETKPAHGECNFCNAFFGQSYSNDMDPNEALAQDASTHKLIVLIGALILISAALSAYLVTSKRAKLISTLSTTSSPGGGHGFFESNRHHHHEHHQPTNGMPVDHGQLHKNSTLNKTISGSNAHMNDACFLGTNRDKNLTSPIIGDHNNKTSIPSKYWAQPGSIIGRTIRRIPNEYEIPSSRTNSTGTSSAVYADMNNTNCDTNNGQRFFSPYNLHTYSEVREVLDPNEHFHTSSNSSVMMSESIYDNATHLHGPGNCLIANSGLVATAPNGSVQMSDLNTSSMRTIPTHGQAVNLQGHPAHNTQAKIIQQQNQSIYELPPTQRAQVIITSNNQGVNPTLLNYRERIHNVI